jgi:two-component system, NtrC family, sensor kinase
MRVSGRPRVLIVDDELSVREVCTRALTRAGYEPTAVATGEEAIAAVRRETYDVIVLDVRMPGMDGPEVLRTVREIDPDAPCLIISGYSDFEDAIACLRHGAADFVRKPFDLDTVIRAVDRVLASTHLKVDSALLAATKTIFSSLDPGEISRQVLTVVGSLLHARAATLTLCLDDEPGETFRAVDGAVAEAAPITLPPAAWRRVRDLREPVVLSGDNPANAEIIAALCPAATGLLVVRLSVGDRTVGLLSAARHADDRAFGERDLRRAMVLAGHSALALDNARLHAETGAQARALEHALDRLVVAERVATLGRLSAGLGHEIANPAYAIMTNLEAAREVLGAGHPDQALPALDRAAAGASAILQVCQALRPLGSDSLRRRDELVDLRRVLDSALLLAAAELQRRASVRVELPEGLPPIVGNAAKLGQIFLNLLLNASEAIPLGAAQENEVAVIAQVIDHEVVVRVADTGRGVPADLQPRLFEASVTTKVVSEGHGMGLAICRWLLEELQGSIRCLPDVPRGAVFEVRLPIHRLAADDAYQPE